MSGRPASGATRRLGSSDSRFHGSGRRRLPGSLRRRYGAGRALPEPDHRGTYRMCRFLWTIPLLLLAAPVGAAEPLAAVIQRANNAFSAAFNKGDGAAVAQMYTEQATILPAGADMMKGRDAIQKYWQGGIQSGLKNVALTAVSVEPYGRSTLREIGRFSFDAPGQGNVLQPGL